MDLDLRKGPERKRDRQNSRNSVPTCCFVKAKDDSNQYIFWPRDLLPNDLPNARVLTYGYAPLLDGLKSVNGACECTFYAIAWDFLTTLESVRHTEPKRPLVFVVHGMGRLIVIEATQRSRYCESARAHLRNIYKSTLGIAFSSTRHKTTQSKELALEYPCKFSSSEGVPIDEQRNFNFLPPLNSSKGWPESFLNWLAKTDG
jgi:hypothetical protein